MRFWRRLAVACCGAAAVLVISALVLRIEIRLEPQQVVLRWGSEPHDRVAVQSLPKALPSSKMASSEGDLSPATEEQLRLISQLIHALADTAEDRELRWRQEFVQLRGELRDLQHRTVQWR